MGSIDTGSGMVPTIDIQELGAKVVVYGEINHPYMRDFNPSIAYDSKGKLKIAVRRCNFAVHRGGKWYFRDGSAYSKTDVIYGDLDPYTLAVTGLSKLGLSSDSPTRTLVAGLEDVRLFNRKDGMHAIGFESDRVTAHLHNQSAKLAEYVIKGDQLKYIRTLEKPRAGVVEKNWQPTDYETDKFDFTYSPDEVVTGGQVIGVPYKGNIHGGSQLLLQGDGTYLSLVHEKIQDKRYGNVYDRYVYVTYLARHNEYGRITELSKGFRFGTHENIEFASGMVENGDSFIISLGIRDAKYAIVSIRKDILCSLF